MHEKINELIAIFTNLPPEHSGIAVYSAGIIKELQKYYKIHIFTNSNSCQCNDNVHSHLCFVKLIKEYNYRAIIYQLGNHESFNFIYPYLVYYPGITILHDINLYQSRTKYLLSKNKFKEYVDEMFFCHNYTGKRLAEISLKYPIPNIVGFLFSMNKLVIECSLSIGVHTKFYYHQLSFNYPQKKIYYIPMSLGTIDNNISDHQLVDKFIKDDKSILIGSAGYVETNKNILNILKAILHIKKNYNIKFIWIGEDKKNLIQNMLRNNFTNNEQEILNSTITVTGYLNDREFIDLLKCLDIFINLRYPTAGEFSGVLWLVMQLGKAIIIPDLPHLIEIPKNYVFKIDLVNELESLIKALSYLIEDNNKRKELGTLIKKFAIENYSINKTIDVYKSMIEETDKVKKTFNYNKQLPEHYSKLSLEKIFVQDTEILDLYKMFIKDF